MRMVCYVDRNEVRTSWKDHIAVIEQDMKERRFLREEDSVFFVSSERNEVCVLPEI